MGFYDRIIGDEAPKISAHKFQAAVNEVYRGRLTQNQVATYFQLSPDEITEVTTLISRITGGQLTVKEVEDVFYLAEDPASPYGTASLLKTRLGV